MFFNLNSAETNDALQAEAQRISPLLTDYGNDIRLNEALFKRIKTVYDQRETLSLTAEQQTLLEKTYRQSVKGQKMYTVSYILLSDETEARQWIARLRSGASFEKAAREHSKHPLSAKEGGKLGTFATCRWAKDTVQMLDTLKPGQIHAKPVKASAGWSIYRLDAVKPLEPISYAQYKEQLLSASFKPECLWVPPVTVGVPREP